MTTLREAAQQALEAMESAEVDPHSSDVVYKAITALKAALAEYDKDRVKVEEMKANWALQRKLRAGAGAGGVERQNLRESTPPRLWQFNTPLHRPTPAQTADGGGN